MKIDSKNYKVTKNGGRSLIDSAPVFSPDGSSVLIICKDKICVYNVKTSDLSHILESENQDSPFIHVEFPECEPYNLYGFTRCQSVITWTWETGVILREKKLLLKEDLKILTANVLNSRECLITSKNKSKGYVHIATHSLENGELISNIKAHKSLIYIKIWSVAVNINETTKFAVICNGTSLVYVVNLESGEMESYKNYNDIRVLTVATHPNASSFVIGDALGRATIFSGNIFGQGKIARNILHWHALPLFAVAFSLQGNYLLTGGLERVLVKWTLGSLANKPKDQMFMPRCDAQIKYISTNNDNIALSLSNNSILILDAQLLFRSEITECGGLSQLQKSLGSNIVWHKPLGVIILPAIPGHLNLFSTRTNKVIITLDVSMLNQIPATREKLMPIDMEVTCAAVDLQGKWLVTSEYRNDSHTYPEERLKFWEAVKLPFKLNTCVVLSHGGCRLKSITLANNGEICITAGTDQKFRVWKVEQGKNKIFWSCVTACYYDISGAGTLEQLNMFKDKKPVDEFKLPYLRRYAKKNEILTRIISDKDESAFVNNEFGKLCISEAKDCDLEISGVAISQDSSLIAAWFGPKLTVWNTSDYSVKTVLSHRLLKPRGVDVLFGNQDTAHYLVCTTESCLAVWNLLSCSIKWLVNIAPISLTADQLSNRMAVITKNNDVYVFTPHSSEPLLCKRSILPPAEGLLNRCSFGPANGPDNIRLYFLRNDCEIFTLEPLTSTDSEQLEIITKRHELASNFSALVAQQQTSLVTEQSRGSYEFYSSQRQGSKALHEFLSAPAHTLPPVSSIASSFLEQLVGISENEMNNETESLTMDIDERLESSDEDESPVNHRREEQVKVYSTEALEEGNESLDKVVKSNFKWVKLIK